MNLDLPKNGEMKIYRILILYGFETWSLILRVEGKINGVENRMLRRIFGPNRDNDQRRMDNTAQGRSSLCVGYFLPNRLLLQQQ
jgi:hypothetical protein